MRWEAQVETFYSYFIIRISKSEKIKWFKITKKSRWSQDEIFCSKKKKTTRVFLQFLSGNQWLTVPKNNPQEEMIGRWWHGVICTFNQQEGMEQNSTSSNFSLYRFAEPISKLLRVFPIYKLSLSMVKSLGNL